jgi:hypothetical protein
VKRMETNPCVSTGAPDSVPDIYLAFHFGVRLFLLL